MTQKSKLPNSFIRARRELLLDHPFFGSLVMYLTPVLDPEAETTWVDGKNFGFNPEYFDKLSPPQGASIIARAIIHCALEHPIRRDYRTPELWNTAGEHAVNPIIETSGLQQPEGSPKSDSKFEGMGAEEIYALLEKEQPPGSGKSPPKGGNTPSTGSGASTPPPGSGKGQRSSSKAPGAPGKPQPGAGNDPPPVEVRDLPGDAGGQPSPAEKTSNKEEWKINIQQAINSAKGQGFYPAELEKQIEMLLNPEVDWREQLAQWFKSTARNESSWTRKNRRYQGVYLPGMKSTASGVGIVFLDTSGSIWGSPRLLEQFNAELNGMLSEVRPERLYIVHVDAAVQKVEEFAPDDYPVMLKAQGGGGTDFRPAFAWVEEQGLTPDWTVYLTDLMGDFPEHEPEYPVLWAATEDHQAPFGETIRLKEVF